MLKRYIVYLILVVTFVGQNRLYSQSENLDSLKAKASFNYSKGDFGLAKESYKLVFDYYQSTEMYDSIVFYGWNWLRCKNKFYEEDVLKHAEDLIRRYESKVNNKSYIFRLMIVIGSYYTNLEDPESYLEYSKKILAYYTKHKLNDPPFFSNYYKLLAYNYNNAGKADSSEYYALKNIAFIKKHFDDNDVEFGYAYYNLANFYSSYSRAELADSFYSLALQNLELNLEPDHPNIAILLYVYSSELISLGKYEKAREYCYQAISILEQKGMELFKGYAYLNLSRVESAVENLSTYKLYLDKAFEIIDSLEGFPSMARSNVYDGYTGYYIDQEGKYDIALDYQRKSLHERLAMYSEAHPNIVQSYFNFANIYRRLNNYDSAYFYVQKALDEANQLKLNGGLEYANIIFEKGNIEFARENYPDAIALYQSAIKNYLEKFDDKHKYILSGYVEIYKSYKELGVRDSMMHYLTLSTSPLFNKSENEQVIVTVNLLEACLSKIKIELENANSEKEYGDVFADIERLDLSQLLRQSMITDKGDVEVMNITIDSIYVLGIKYAIEAYTHFGNKKWLDQAIEFDYLNKSRSIQTKIEEDQILEISGLDSASIAEYKDLRMEARYLDIASSGQADYQPENLQQRKIIHKRKLQEWEKLNSKKLKNRFQSDAVSLEDYKPMLCGESDFIFLSFSILESNYNCLKISCEKADFIKLDRVDVIDSLIFNYRQALLNNKIKEIYSLGVKLYQALIRPLHINEGSKVHIIPVGLLNAINFETFIVSENNAQSLKEMDWAINRYEISYGINLPVIKENSRKQLSDMLIIAPGFQDTDIDISNGLNKKVSSTPWTVKLAQELAEQHKAILLTGEDANLDQWERHKMNKEIIHIGTHASIDQENPLNSKLLLSRNGEGITFFDIYKSDLNSELVVLAGCETGLGQMVDSKELLSMAHAFQYAGNDQLIQSMWKIDDESTNLILAKFYQNYDKTKEVSSALRKAKIDYINEASENFVSPYYWGGLIYVGNDVTTSQPSTSFGLIFLFLTLGIILIYAIIKKVKKN